MGKIDIRYFFYFSLILTHVIVYTFITNEKKIIPIDPTNITLIFFVSVYFFYFIGKGSLIRVFLISLVNLIFVTTILFFTKIKHFDLSIFSVLFWSYGLFYIQILIPFFRNKLLRN